MASSLHPTAEVESSETKLVLVQEVTKEPITTVPDCFIRSDQEPLISNHLTPLPTVDLEKLLAKDSDELAKLHSTCKEWGIFQLINHRVSSSAIEKLKDEMEKFYKLPIEEKLKYRILPSDVEGYGALARTGGKIDWGDRFFVITNPVHLRKPHLFPALPASFRNALESYLSELQKLGMKLLGQMAKALKIDWKEVEEMFEDGYQTLRMSYYPPCPEPEKVTGLVPHFDASGITILLQVNRVDGLQIKKDGVWFPVSFHPDSVVINIGDILEILSNGLYHSVEHRTGVNLEKERISIGFFMNPKFEANVGPLTTLISKENPAIFTTVRMEEYNKSLYSRVINKYSNNV